MLSNPNAVVRRRKDSTGSELVRRRLIAVVDTLLYTAKVVFFGIFLIAEYIFLSLECMYSCSRIMRPAFEKRLRICLGLSKYHYTCCCTKIKENHQASQEQFYTPGAQAWWRMHESNYKGSPIGLCGERPTFFDTTDRRTDAHFRSRLALWNVPCAE